MAQIIKHGVISRRQENQRNYNAWPSIITLPDGKLLCGWSGDREKHVCPFGKVLTSVSSDGGYTWSEPTVSLNTPLDDRDCGLLYNDGAIYLTSFNNSKVIQEEWQATHNYSQEEIARYNEYLDTVSDETEKKWLGSLVAVSFDNGRSFGTPFLTPVSSPHGPCVLPDGSVLYIGRTFTDPKEASFPYLPEGIWAVKITPDGQVSQPWQVVAPHPDKTILYCEPHAVATKDGRILLGIRTQNYDSGLFTVHDCFSFDGGKTFSPPRPLDIDGAPPHYLVTKEGEIVLTYGRRKAPFGQYARVSYDNGETWSEEIVLRADAPNDDLGYPCSTQNENGDIVTVYYQKTDLSQTGNFIRYTIWRI